MELRRLFRQEKQCDLGGYCLILNHQKLIIFLTVCYKYVTHTWLMHWYYRYETMLRIQKKYSLRFRKSVTSKKLIHGFDMSFSSFPGGIQSGDDFYLISSGLATLETTIENYNTSLWSNVKPVGQVQKWFDY